MHFGTHSVRWSLTGAWGNLLLSATVLVTAALPSLAQPGPYPVLTPYHKNGIYELGEKAGWTVTMPEGAPVPTGPYTYTVKANQQDTVKSGELDLSSGKTTLEVPSDKPAMMYVQLSPPPAPAPDPNAPAAPAAPAAGGFGGRGFGGRGGPNYALTLGAAIAPAKLQPSVPKPADFDAFWDGKLKELANVPINPQLTPQETTTPGVELSMFKLDSLNSNVQGYIAKPAKEGKFPALILYQYAGVYTLPPTNATSRAAQGWLCMNVDSHDVAPNSVEGVPQNYNSVGNDDREKSYFLNMYLRDTRAVQYIKSRPDWDGKTIVLMGTSMGGQQSLATAGLNDGITAVIVWVPSGADSNADLHGRKQGYPNWNARNSKVMETALYFDTVNFATRIKAPTFIAMGFLDTISPAAGVWTAYNQIPGPKEAIPLVEAAHNNQVSPDKERAYTVRSQELLSTILKGGQFTANGIPPA